MNQKEDILKKIQKNLTKETKSTLSLTRKKPVVDVGSPSVSNSSSLIKLDEES